MSNQRSTYIRGFDCDSVLSGGAAVHSGQAIERASKADASCFMAYLRGTMRTAGILLVASAISEFIFVKPRRRNSDLYGSCPAKF